MAYSRPWMFGGLTLMAIGAALLWQQERQPLAMAEPSEKASRPTAGQSTEWQSLFDGKSLQGWRVPQFGGDGEVDVEEGAIVLGMGSLLTGVAWNGEIVRNNYEIELEGKRLDGCDFFCTTTFPVGKEFCSLVVGGWGGQLVGLSSIDYMDASENTTTRTMEFKNGRWYPVRIRVSESAVQAWIDGKLMVNQPRKDHVFSLRMEVTDCRPLGIASWCTKGAVRNIRIRSLKPDELQTADAPETDSH